MSPGPKYKPSHGHGHDHEDRERKDKFLKAAEKAAGGIQKIASTLEGGPQQGIARLQETVDAVASDVSAILSIVRKDKPPGTSLGAYVAAIHGRSSTMPVNVTVPQLLDTEKILLSVMPRKADGHVDTAAVITWVSSDPTQVGIEPGTTEFVFHDPQFDEDVTCPGVFNCFALTPLDTGTGTVTVSAPGYESAEFGPINYAPGVPRSLNASVGSPISDITSP